MKLSFLFPCLHTAAIIIALLTTPSLQASPSIQPLKIGSHERLLVLAPHPDDETLSAAGLIQQVFDHGGTVRSVVVTSGDAYVEAIQRDLGKTNLSSADYIHYGEKRLQESRSAAHVLGHGYIHLDLYGFSDGSIYPMLVSHWGRTHPDRSGFTGYSHVPYVEAEDKGIAQEGELLRNELVAILRATKPTMIVFPDVMENDSDHAGLGMFALLAINDWLEHSIGAEPNPRLFAYLIHWQHGWPSGSTAEKPLDLSTQPLFLPDDLPLRGLTRTCTPLNEAERLLKREALAQYHTQQRAMGSFLAAFVRSNECYTELTVNDSKGIENVVRQWQHVRKSFDSHPITRRKIWQLN
ncbi:MAG: PIG-L family deacetylase [Methylococcales bacterium]|nr:MAG: PIG-L family deacetylase [Methylococcales bacterium]